MQKNPRDTGDDMRDQVRRGYAAIATATEAEPCCAGGCCGGDAQAPEQIAAAVGYDADDVRGLPDGANMGLSCGNPHVIASLREGETVLDLGSGGGFDCFLAGPKVGAAGRVIGVDMTPEMLAKARRGLDAYRRSTGLGNVEFRLGEIEHLPVGDASVDAVISNCVLNLVPDKPRAWREIARVLAPGGRVAISDLALLRPLPADLQNDAEALVGCIAGAVEVDAIRRDAEAAGLVDVRIEARTDYVDAMSTWQDPLYARLAGGLPEGATLADFITSAAISARKP
ncbi:MAG: arsenite methyltransferase [Planctomycetota bacterium]